MKKTINRKRFRFWIGYFKKPSTWLFWVILGLALFLRFKGLWSREVWYDEVLDVMQASKNIATIGKEVPTPVHYIIIHLFLIFGKNTFILGLPSAIMGSLTVMLVYFIGRDIFESKRVAFISMLLAAISPMMVEFSQQILHYSYLLFFSTLSFYIFTRLFVVQRSLVGRARAFLFLALLLVNLLNILTHVSAFLVIIIEVLYLSYYLSKKMKLSYLRRKWKISLIGLIVISLFIVIALYFGSGYYIKLFQQAVHIGVNKPFEIGYSLSEQLGSTVASYSGKFITSLNGKFVLAIMAWYGLGNGWRLTLYLGLFVVGIVYTIKNKRSLWPVFIVCYPFVHIFFIKTSHWFEEKYFIFVIPFYVCIIGYGLVRLSELLTVVITRHTYLPRKIYIRSYLLIIITTIVLLSAYYPINTRATYGFPIKGKSNVLYSWRKVYDYLQVNNLGQQYRVFVANGEGAFFNFYYPEKDKGRVWFEESSFFTKSKKEHDEFVGVNINDYFISIPEIEDTFAGGALDAKKIDRVGGFNVYQLKFKNNRDQILSANQRGDFEYYEDFKNAKLLGESYDWKNIGITYKGILSLPTTYGRYHLKPLENENYLLYHFIWPPNYQKSEIYFQAGLAMCGECGLKVSKGNSPSSMRAVYNSPTGQTTVEPYLKIMRDNQREQDFYLKFEFISSEKKIDSQSDIRLLYFQLMSHNRVDGVQIGANNTLYDAELGINKRNYWLNDAIDHFGWVQATDGILFSLPEANKNTLIYKFKLNNYDKEKINLAVKTFTFDNKITLSTSRDGSTWSNLSVIKNKNINEDTFSIKVNKKESLFVKFLCDKPGPTCQIRDFKLNSDE